MQTRSRKSSRGTKPRVSIRITRDTNGICCAARITSMLCTQREVQALSTWLRDEMREVRIGHLRFYADAQSWWVGKKANLPICIIQKGLKDGMEWY